MSYTEFLRRKMAGEPVVVNNQRLRTASELTQERRLMASSFISPSGFADGTSNGRLQNGGLRTGQLNVHAPTSAKKNTGRPASASDFTSYRGSFAIQNGNTFANGVVQNAGKNVQPPACVVNSSAKIADPVPYITGTTSAVKANSIARSGSDFIRERLACQQAQGEQHIQNELGKSVFVDDTIRKPEYNKQYLSGATKCAPNTKFPAVDHVHSVVVPRNQTGVFARPVKSKVPVYAVPCQDHVPALVSSLPNCFTGKNTTGKFSQGSVVPSKHPRYVERHHGNAGSGLKPVPTRYQIPAGTPAHLKINDPLGPRTPNM